jgi:hypothetical protein
MIPFSAIRIISGGQSGADRAALDFATAHAMAYGGWCPKDGWAEDMTEPPGLLTYYPNLRETPERDPRQRTEWNVRDSDATLVLVPASGLSSSRGTGFTVACAQNHAKPCLVIDPSETDSAERIHAWLQSNPDITNLNIAGPRETESPGIYAAGRSVLELLLCGGS